jgi:DNA-directed RNA polymerase subunit D
MQRSEKNKEKLIFLKDIEEGITNALRRYAHQIPVLAIDEVEISMNDSPLYDETIAHRLGLVPLKAKGAVNDKTNVTLKLNSKKQGYIYSGDLQGDAEVVYKNMPITLLKEGQEMKVNALAKAGKGETHSKFSPGIIFYRNTFNVKIDKDCPLSVAEFCPQKIIKIKDNKLIVEDEMKCDGCELCLEKCPKKEKEMIKITPTDKLLITIESFGQMDPADILKKSIDLLRKDLNDVSKELK